MIDFEKIKNDYLEYSYNKKYYKKVKAEPHIFYMTHRDEIDPYIEEYYEYENDHNKIGSERLLKDHPVLKIYLALDFERDIFESRMKASSMSSELKKLGKCVTYIFFKNETDYSEDSKCFCIYDIDSKTNYIYENPDSKIIDYIKRGLMKLDIFVADIYNNETSLVDVIYSEILLQSGGNLLTNKQIYNKINREILRARVFDSGIMLNDSESNLPSNVEEYKEIIKLYDEGLINKDEYYIRLYKCRILSECDVIKMYLNADSEQREYIIDAYYELSTSTLSSNNIHIRTASKEINDQVLKRIRKKTDTI